MPMRPPRICAGCGRIVRPSDTCPCQKARKARADARRPSARERGYSSAWDKASADYLAAHPWCVMCAEYGQRRLATVTDHVIPHRGDKRLFWDRSNWQGLCGPHHNSTKQSAEKREHASCR
jgi:5-methylcytosine-specific restriction protein A